MSLNYKVFFLPVARDDIQNAKDWYEKQRIGLGSEFELSVEVFIEGLKKNPDRYPPILEHIRKGNIKRFPYSVAYVVEDQKIVVLTVMHVKRDPQYLWKRIEESGYDS